MNIPDQLASQTPCLLLNKSRLQNNIDKMISRYAKTNITLRPHLKTSKSIGVTNLFRDAGINKFTVSTLKEAEYFANNGIKDLFYAVSIVANKIGRVVKLNNQGANISICVDSVETVEALNQSNIDKPVDLYIEINVDNHRTGVNPEDKRQLISIASKVDESNKLNFKGVFAHAGESYSCTNLKEIKNAADNERKLTCRAAQHIRDAGLNCPVISVGSTPTVSVGGDFYEVNEVRAGVFTFQDLFQSNLGSCKQQEIALSVLTSVISHSPVNNRLVIDAGGMALSKDRSTASQKDDCKYGLVTDVDGNIIDNLIVDAVNQEHGYVTTIDGSPVNFTDFSLGRLLRVLPNHACMTAAAHSGYHVVEKDEASGEENVTDFWSRVGGW